MVKYYCAATNLLCMIKKVSLVMVLLFAFAVTRAQTVHVGIKTDFTSTKISGNGLSSSFQAGYQAGGFAEINLNKKWGVQPELLFSQRNSKKGDDFSVYYINTASPVSNEMIKLNYITIPVLLKYNINSLFTVNLGPQISYLVFEDEDLLKGNKDAFKKTDFGLVGGVQLNISPSFKIYGRYNYGLSNINNIDDRYKWKTQQIQLGVGVHIF